MMRKKRAHMMERMVSIICMGPQIYNILVSQDLVTLSR